MIVALTRFDFPVAVSVLPEVLGVRSRLVLPGVDAELCLPEQGDREVGFEGQFRSPALQDVKWFDRVNEHVYNDWNQEGGWGGFHSGGAKPEFWAGHISGGILRVRVAEGTRDCVDLAATALRESILDWYTRLRDWIEVLTEQDLDHEHPRRTVEQIPIVMNAIWTFRSAETKKPTYEPINAPLTIRQPPGRPLARAEWLRSVRAANAGVRPPEQFLMLRDARRAGLRGSARRCVLDAATSVEMTLSPLLGVELTRRLGESATDVLSPSSQPISVKLRALEGLGVTLPEKLQSDLFNVRNKVIHRGVTPTPTEATRALAAAANVVANLVPLP